METLVENKSRKIALTLTIGLHVLLFLFLLLAGFSIPKNRHSEMVNNKGGLSMAGYELIEMDAVIPASASPSSKLISDPNEKEFKLEKTNIVIKSTNTDASEGLEYETALKKWNSRKKVVGNNVSSSVGSSENISTGNNEGKDASDDKEESFFLINRTLIQKPEAILNSTEEGKVVVNIVVNESGNVIRAVAGQRGSTTTNAILYAKAVNAALTARFSPSKGIKEQGGTYTFVFSLE